MEANAPFELSALETALGGGYEVSGLISTGGQGFVYRASIPGAMGPEGTSTEVALKVFRPSGEEERVDREISLLTEVRHPCLAGVQDYGQVALDGDDLRYIAYEFIPGSSVRELLSEGEMSDTVVCNIAADISDALETVWNRRIVHRDIKPSNIMYMPDEDRAILIDLAYARHIGKTSLTTFGRTYGTIGYMSPEQFLRAERSLTCKSDVFSLGVVLLESATGCHPTGRDQRVLARNPPQSRKLIPDFPDDLKHLFDCMLSRRPAFRPTPAEVRDAMGAFLQG